MYENWVFIDQKESRHSWIERLRKRALEPNRCPEIHMPFTEWVGLNLLTI